MKTSEYIETILGIQLLDCQKVFVDYLDEHPDAKIIMPRGKTITSTYELWILARIIKSSIERK